MWPTNPRQWLCLGIHGNFIGLEIHVIAYAEESRSLLRPINALHAYE
jgi:hypothetical protein